MFLVWQRRKKSLRWKYIYIYIYTYVYISSVLGNLNTYLFNICTYSFNIYTYSFYIYTYLLLQYVPGVAASKEIVEMKMFKGDHCYICYYKSALIIVSVGSVMIESLILCLLVIFITKRMISWLLCLLLLSLLLRVLRWKCSKVIIVILITKRSLLSCRSIIIIISESIMSIVFFLSVRVLD
jgi:hypothetical protein